ncbi:hypothetical protein [Mesorhizobium sp. SP-1A]|nr:hypothetical protein [Mesorhizobium sp. SP-1A]
MTIALLMANTVTSAYRAAGKTPREMPTRQAWHGWPADGSTK